MTSLKWITALTVLTLTLVAGITVASSVPPAYQANGSMVLLGPSEKLVDVETNETEPVNPYAELTPKLETMATVIAHSVTEGRTAHEFEERGHNYTVEVDGPIVGVEATNSEPQAAIATVLTLFAAIERELRVRQDRIGSPANLQITGEVLAAPGPATETTIDRDRAVAATIGLGLVAAFGASALVDRVQAARQRRYQRRRAAAATRPPGPSKPATPRPAAEQKPVPEQKPPAEQKPPTEPRRAPPAKPQPEPARASRTPASRAGSATKQPATPSFWLPRRPSR